MSDLVGNPEDRFSQNEAHMPFCWFCHVLAEIKTSAIKFLELWFPYFLFLNDIEFQLLHTMAGTIFILSRFLSTELY